MGLAYIALDSEGIRLEFTERWDILYLQQNGPYSMEFDGCNLMVSEDPSGMLHACVIHQERGRNGLRRVRHATQPAFLGRFGPQEIDVDLGLGGGFIAELPPIYERPWPVLTIDCPRYNYETQLLVTLAERLRAFRDDHGVIDLSELLSETRIPSSVKRRADRDREFRANLLKLVRDGSRLRRLQWGVHPLRDDQWERPIA